MSNLENAVLTAIVGGVSGAVFYYALIGGIGTVWRWLTLGRRDDTATTWRMCGASVDLGQTDVTHENTPMESLGKSPARRSLNPYREIRRLKQEVADAVACRDETQRLLEMQYVSMVEVVKAVNYMSTTGIAIQTKVGKA